MFRPLRVNPMQTITDLDEYCRLHPLEDKVLVGATSLQARLWRERLVREGSPWIALRAASVHSLAEEFLFASPSVMHSAIATVIPTLAEHACREGLRSSERFSALRGQPGVHAAFREAITDLELAGLDTASFHADDLGTPDRLADLTSVAAIMTTLRRDNCLVDYPELLRLALHWLNEQPPASKPVLLLPHSVYESLAPLERRVIAAACSGEPIVLGTAPGTTAAKGVKFRSAFTPAHEFRSALRDVTAKRLPLDSVEFVYTDSGKLPTLYELCIEADLPCTFAEGIPVQYSKAARTLQRFLEWLRDGEPYPLIRLMYEGIPDFTAFASNDVRANRLPAAALLRDSRIGRGVQATLPRVDRFISLREREGFDGEQFDALRAARNLIEAICALIPVNESDGTIRYHDLIRSSMKLMLDLCRPASPGEPQAVESIGGMLASHALGPDIALPLADACARVLAALKALRMPMVIKAVGGAAEQSSSPLPGHVFVTDLVHAGISGRAQVFLFGMDDAAMPGDRSENPVLLDAERGRISQRTGIDLPRSPDHRNKRRRLLHAFLSRCGASITVSFARRDDSGLRVQGPSRELLALFRKATANPHAAYRDLDAALPPPAGDVPDSRAASVQEWRLSQLDHVPAPLLAEALRNSNPMLRSGHEAEEARDSLHFTSYDGAVGPMEGELPVQSVSALEQLAGCPYNYFLRRILRLFPPQSMRLDAGRWLTPAEHGSLVHDVLRSFMQCVSTEAVPRNRWRQRMDALVESALSAIADDNPPPGDASRKRSERDLREACEIFLRDELSNSGVTPLAFELPFPAEYELSPPLTPLSAPLRMETPQGDVLLKGIIDRVDMTQDGVLLVTDYKTGKDRSKASRPLAGGTRLQPAVYSEAVRRMAEGSHRGDVRFVYRYLSTREQGRIVEVAAPDEDAADSIGLLLELRKQGSFAHTADAAQCGMCEFVQVCGRAETTAARMKSKLDHSPNTELEPLRRLRDDY
jgi:RecB family exonuclease